MPVRILAALVAGGVLSLAFEPVAIAYLMPLSLAVLALTTRNVRVRAGFLVGLSFGIGFYFPHIYWMSSSIGAVAWIALASIEAFFHGLFGMAAAVLHRLRAWPFWLAGAWLAMEFTRSTWPFSGMPWGRLGFGVVDTPLAPALAYVGVNGVSLVVAALGFLLARVALAARGDERLYAGVGLVGLTSVAVVPSVVPWTLPTSDQVTVAAVQGDVPGAGNDILADFRGVTQNHVDATVALADDVAAGLAPQPDFVLWPENSTAVDPFLDVSTNAQITTAVTAIGVPVVVGAIVDAGPDNILNQGIVWDPVTGAGERYTKRHPVPMGEFIPFRGAFERLGLTDGGQLARIGRDMLSGKRTTPLVVAGIPLADAICFDIAYDDGLAVQQENGAELLTVQTSNASFIFTDQVEQQFAMTRARAIESGKYVVVAATNGVSGVIAPDGSVVDRTQRLTQDVIVETVDLRAGLTPAVRVGAALPLLAMVSSAFGLLLGLVSYRRGRTRQRAAGADESQPTSADVGA
ncbi:apolipoprotein N-acyltransferase [Nocardioides sp.]|uniref:apolipoprotein N-acyltransferase n=1 Tax=Nocardioides sp. TaxID=35761 RepID=UPI002B269EC9|nr:apolipoprotein N-acyltransferase [Nocardioides sp.]